MSLADVILSAMLTLPVYSEDVEATEAKRAQLTAIAEAIAESVSDQSVATRRDWAALLVAVGYAESGFSLRIHAGQCDWERRECDAATVKGERVFRARGIWQLHRYAEAAPVWDKMHGLEHIKVQAAVASSRLARGYWTCRGTSDWFIATVNGFAGRKCNSVWPGLEQRYAIYKRIRRAMYQWRPS